MIDRVERLTNLLALLLETAEPLSLVQIAGELDGQYPEGHAARRGAFERDKSALREIGVPIEQEVVAGGEYAGQTRYWIDRARYELRDLDLADDEMRALQVALAATRASSTSAQEALWKLGAGLLEPTSPVVVNLPDDVHLPELRQAVAGRGGVRFRYGGRDRTVDAWGLLLRDGYWYVIGYDHSRGARRTFRIDRIEGGVEAAGEASMGPPEDFDPLAAIPVDPKTIGEVAAEARVLVDPPRARRVLTELGEERVVRRLADGAIEFAVACSNLPAFRSWLLGLLDDAEVLGPPEVRRHVVVWLEGIAS